MTVTLDRGLVAADAGRVADGEPGRPDPEVPERARTAIAPGRSRKAAAAFLTVDPDRRLGAATAKQVSSGLGAQNILSDCVVACYERRGCDGTRHRPPSARGADRQPAHEFFRPCGEDD